MKFIRTVMLLSLASTPCAYLWAANDNPDQILNKAASVTVSHGENIPLKERWQQFVYKNRWGAEEPVGEVMHYPDRGIVAASAVAFTKVDIGQPGWNESRVAAFERAELEAKTKIVRFLSDTSNASRSVSMFEKAAWSDGSVEEVEQIGQYAAILEKIGKKTLALGDAALDSALRKLDPEYDPDDFENKSIEQVEIILQDRFQRKIRGMAFQTLVGATPVYNAEGSVGNEYQVLVGVVWSPKLSRLAKSLANDEYAIPPAKPGRPVDEQVPTDESMLLSLWGTRIVVDENGEYAVVSYAQAQPRKTSPSRVQSALHVAKNIAAERARAQIIHFIKEGLAFEGGETSSELQREFTDMTVGTQTLRDYQSRITSSKTRVTLKGLRVLREWGTTHPATGQHVAGAVVVWSPTGVRMSDSIREAMSGRPAQAATKKDASAASDIKDVAPRAPIIESMPIDTTAY